MNETTDRRDGSPSRSRGPSFSETLASMLVLLTLAAVAAGVYRAHLRYNPAVLAFREIAGRSEAPAAPSGEKKAETLFALPPGFLPMSPPEHFDRATLSDKIDGKAELYLPAGFRELSAQRLRHEGSPEVWYEIFVYDMGKRLNAFSVFSAQRRDDAEPADFARFAYGAGNALFWVRGPLYAEIVASEASPEVSRRSVELAKAFNEQHPAAAGSIDELELFPERGLVQGGLVYIPANAFGFEGLDRVFAAAYRLDGADAEATAFLSRRESEEEARRKADEFVRFMLDFGGERASGFDGDAGVRIVDFLGAFDAVAVSGRYLAGVHEAPDSSSAAVLMKALMENLGREDTKTEK